MPIVCMQCSLRALVAGDPVPVFDETPEAHLARCHPDLDAAAAERRALEQVLAAQQLAAAARKERPGSMIVPCAHDWEQIACVYRAEVDAAEATAHTSFHLLGCSTCRTVDAFPVMNAELATGRYITRLRGELAAGGWLLPADIAWRGARTRG